MKSGVKKIIGKTVVAVVVGESGKKPRRMVNLLFSDGTHFEFYGDDFSGAGGVDKGGVEKVVAYIEGAGGRVLSVHTENS